MKRLTALVFVSVLEAIAAPCTNATRDCTGKVSLGLQGNFSIVYRNFSLTEPNAAIERALIVVHGSGRNADSYF